MAQSLGTNYTGTSRMTNIPTEQRIYDRNKLLVRIAHGRPAFMRIIMENFKRSTITATDPQPKYKSDPDRNIGVQCSVASGAYAGGTENLLYFADADAPLIQEGDSLLVNEVFFNGTAFTTTRSVTNYQYETMLVLQKLTSDGTNTSFVVQRGFGFEAAGTPTQIETTFHLTLLPNSMPTGSDERASYSDVPGEETNYCQIVEEKWSVDETTSNTVIYQDEDILTRNGRKAVDLFFKKLEWGCIHGKKSTSNDARGRTLYWFGGLQEYIAQDQTTLAVPTGLNYKGTNVVDFKTGSGLGNVNPQTVNYLLKDKFYYGDPEMKFWIMGEIAYTAFCNAFDPKVRIVNPELTKKYGIEIVDFKASNGGTVHILHHDLMSINGQTTDTYICDFSHFKYMHLQNMDIHILRDVGINPHETEHELYGQIGVHRTNPFAHWFIYNFGA